MTTYVRGQERFVHEEVVQNLRNGLLEGLGYNGDPLPWGLSVPLNIVEMSPDPLVDGAKVDAVPPNTVAISEGTVPEDMELQLGAGLAETTHTFFVDIYGETRAHARTIAFDVRALFTGRIEGWPRIISVRNFAAAGAPVLAGHQIEFEDVEVQFPGVTVSAKKHWAVVKLTASHRHP